MTTNKLKNSPKIVIFFQYTGVFDEFNIRYNTYGSVLFVFFKTLSIAQQFRSIDW